MKNKIEFCLFVCRKALGITSPVEDEQKDETSLAKEQIEQSRQRLVKLEEDGLEFVGFNLVFPLL